MSKKHGKTIFKGALSAVLVCAMLASCVACTQDKSSNPGNLEYYQESTAATLGKGSGFIEDNGKFYSDYITLDDAHEAGKHLNVKLAEEGLVLLKNENNALPLTSDERNVTLLGIKSIDIQTGGGGSGNGTAGNSENQEENSYKIDPTTLEGSMTDAGFHLNEKVLQLYRDNIANMS